MVGIQIQKNIAEHIKFICSRNKKIIETAIAKRRGQNPPALKKLRTGKKSLPLLLVRSSLKLSTAFTKTKSNKASDVRQTIGKSGLAEIGCRVRHQKQKTAFAKAKTDLIRLRRGFGGRSKKHLTIITKVQERRLDLNFQVILNLFQNSWNQLSGFTKK